MTSGRSRWFNRETRPIRPELVKTVMEDFTDIAREVKDNHGKVKHRTIDRHCSWCDFEPLCRAEMEGGDVDYLTQKEYYVEEDPDQKKGAVIADKKSKSNKGSKKLGNIRSGRKREDHVERQLSKACAGVGHKRRRN